MNEFSDIYRQRTQLLLRILPIINQEKCFSLKGGTAINLFVQNMPRLSVDIDLAFQYITSRASALFEINQALSRIANNIAQKMPKLRVKIGKSGENAVNKIVVQEKNATVKIETTSVFRGYVFPSEPRELCDIAQELFEMSFEVSTVSLADLYAGKLCAALNRQHPRDLFDVKVLFDTTGINEKLRHAFVVYLAGDRRPIHELLSPKIKNDQESVYNREFRGMTRFPLSLSSLTGIFEKLVVTIQQELTNAEKEFLLSVAAGEPKFNTLNIQHLKDLPALKWKIYNTQKMDAKKRLEQIRLLEACFN